MSKSRSIEIITQDDNRYGQINIPADILRVQEYAHTHIEQVTQDFLEGQNIAEITGCNYSLPSDLNLLVEPGRIYLNGRQYDSPGGTFTLNQADSQYSRIDLIIATLADNVPANLEFLAFQRLRTEQEFIDGVLPYPPTQFQRATEKQNLAPVSIKTGVPAATPIAPALGINEVILYTITVPADAEALQNSNVGDSRKHTSNLRGINEIVIDLQEQIKVLESKVLVLKYRYPTILTSDGEIPFDLVDTDGDYTIDIPTGIDVQFGDGFVQIKAENFPDGYNAQYVNVSNGSFTYLPLLDPAGAPESNVTSGNAIRFDVPATTKTLYLKRDGELFFRDAAEPSNPTECILLKVVRSGSDAPKVKTYRNLRNSRTIYSNTKVLNNATSTQFELDLGVPVLVLYPHAYAVRATDSTQYTLPLPLLVFDGIVTVTGVTDGDTWFVDIYILSAL